MISHILPTRYMRALLCGLLILTAPTATATAADLDNLLTGYALTSWTDGDGVPLGTVYSIAQDRDGYARSGRTLVCFDSTACASRLGTLSATHRFPSSPRPHCASLATAAFRWDLRTVVASDEFAIGQIRPADQPGGALGSIADLIEDHRGNRMGRE